MVALSLGCRTTGSSSVPIEPPPPALTVVQAQAIVDATRKERGIVATKPVAPASLSEVAVILNLDQSDRFPISREYLSGMPGVDALALRAMLEALWAEGQVTVAALAREQAERMDVEVVAREGMLKQTPDDAALKARIETTKVSAQRERELSEALETLSLPHFESSLALADEVVRRNPERADGHVVLANLHRLKRNWVDFERHMQLAQAADPQSVGVLYSRAIERAARLGDEPGARSALEALLAEHPEFARARAQLVLLQDDVEGRYEQLQKLRGLNPQHSLVLFEGPAIESEYESARALRESRRTDP